LQSDLKEFSYIRGKKERLVNQHAKNLIEKLGLTAHPEGGYYRETHRAEMQVHSSVHNETRSAFTSIYFLLDGQNYSAWHRIRCDESWFFHSGCDLEIYTLESERCNQSKSISTHTIGAVTGDFQVTISGGKWFAAKPVDPAGFSFVSCVVGPGFEFKDFELASRAGLMEQGFQQSIDWPRIESLLIQV